MPLPHSWDIIIHSKLQAAAATWKSCALDDSVCGVATIHSGQQHTHEYNNHNNWRPEHRAKKKKKEKKWVRVQLTMCRRRRRSLRWFSPLLLLLLLLPQKFLSVRLRVASLNPFITTRQTKTTRFEKKKDSNLPRLSAGTARLLFCLFKLFKSTQFTHIFTALQHRLIKIKWAVHFSSRYCFIPLKKKTKLSKRIATGRDCWLDAKASSSSSSCCRERRCWGTTNWFETQTKATVNYISLLESAWNDGNDVQTRGDELKQNCGGKLNH